MKSNYILLLNETNNYNKIIELIDEELSKFNNNIKININIKICMKRIKDYQKKLFESIFISFTN